MVSPASDRDDKMAARAFDARCANCILRRRWIHERRLYVVIHSAVRMFLGKCRVQRRRFDTCARHIQSLWRGSRARCADRTWLESVVIPIQKQARGMRSRSRYAKIREEVYAAT